MKRVIFTISILLLISCLLRAADVLPITGTFLNLFYQDVRNKYMNPQSLDCADPDLWREKVKEMHEMGIEYLVFMAVANDGSAAYPSEIMPLNYNPSRKSPVTAIMDEAERLGMKVFMSIGWAQNQDDNLRIPAILQRQKEIMDELAKIYGSNKSFYGWYLPVEDCFGPVLTESAVKAVNALTDKAHKITPGKKTMISPYGFYCSEFENFKYAEQIKKLKVDIIAYQDEIGCVREEYPLPGLKVNWKKIAKIHKECGIELWANCESFTWEKSLNSRNSALIPAAPSRILSQMVAASEAGVSRIISFSFCGIFDSNKGNYWLGQPGVAAQSVVAYGAWRAGCREWKLLEASFRGALVGDQASSDMSMLVDGKMGEEKINDTCWIKNTKGYNEVELSLNEDGEVRSIYVRFLSSQKNSINVPDKVYLYAEQSDGSYSLASVRDISQFPNNLHDTWIEGLELPCNISKVTKVKVGFESTCDIMVDEIILNPQVL